jgi:tripartite-type tricarboxylate transporter receptor subunit TctC
MPTLHGTLLKAAGLLLALTTAVAAQDYPNKPVRLIIPFPPGGSNDVVGRLIATHLSDRLGKQVVVDNRGAGAGGVVGSEVAANAPHDGYTLLIISLAHAVNPWLYKLRSNRSRRSPSSPPARTCWWSTRTCRCSR